MSGTKYQLIAFIIQLLFMTSVLGSYTNWFRSTMDLMRTLSFLVIFVLSLVLFVPTHVYCITAKIRGSESTLSLKLSVVFTVVFVLAVSGYNLVVFGRIYSPVEGRVFKDTPRTFIDSTGNAVEWWVEFVNPFHEKHQERLMISDGSDVRVVPMTLLENKGSFLVADEYISLTQVESNLLLTSRMEGKSYVRYVKVDYQSGSVISNWTEEVAYPRGAEGESGSEESND